MSEDRLLTIPQVADRLSVHIETVRRWIREGRMRGVMLGGTKAGYRVRESDIERFLADRQKGEVS